MLNLHPPEDRELLELLAEAFRQEGPPPASGLVSLLIALDDCFGDLEPDDPEAEHGAVVPLRRRVVRLVTLTAAALVALAVGLAWYGWPRQTGSPPDRAELAYATSSLQRDLGGSSSSVRTAPDVTALARALAQVPPAQQARVGPRPGQLLVEACHRLAGARAPRQALPAPCLALLQLSTNPGATGRPAAAGPDGSAAPTGSSAGTAAPRAVPWYLSPRHDGSPSSVPGDGGPSTGTKGQAGADGTFSPLSRAGDGPPGDGGAGSPSGPGGAGGASVHTGTPATGSTSSGRHARPTDDGVPVGPPAGTAPRIGAAPGHDASTAVAPPGPLTPARTP
ncbi:MAG TPA: hypothetical protein VEH82_11230 [Acidimicrobiales bacterium]|nr:hypothetical protein [Acidimicrobiales bacterium]